MSSTGTPSEGGTTLPKTVVLVFEIISLKSCICVVLLRFDLR